MEDIVEFIDTSSQPKAAASDATQGASDLEAKVSDYPFLSLAIPHLIISGSIKTFIY